MNRARRTRILVRSKTDMPDILASSIKTRYKIEELSAPSASLVMIKKRENAKGFLFYLGEMLVTEAKVKIHDNVGIGLAPGYAGEKAYSLAVIDAAFNAELPETREWIPLLEKEEEKIIEEDKTEELRIARTRVRFESMDREMPK